MAVKKLIRNKILHFLKKGEYEEIKRQDELNHLYALKIKEELAEIQESDHKDVMEFVDLIQVAIAFANENGFTLEQIKEAGFEKVNKKGYFSRVALTNLNPNNPSNKLYFEQDDDSN